MRKYIVPILAICFFLTVAIGAFAADSARFTLTDPAQVAGQKLPAGDYKISWSGSGNNVDVTFSSGKKINVTVKAKLVETPSKNIDYARASVGDKITMFYLAGRNQALAFGE